MTNRQETLSPAGWRVQEHPGSPRESQTLMAASRM